MSSGEKKPMENNFYKLALREIEYRIEVVKCQIAHEEQQLKKLETEIFETWWEKQHEM